jgi:hypothetical protein
MCVYVCVHRDGGSFLPLTVIAGGLTWCIQWCYSGVEVVLQWCHSGVTVVLQWCFNCDPFYYYIEVRYYSGVKARSQIVVFQYYRGVTVVLQFYHSCTSGVSMSSQWCRNGVTEVLPNVADLGESMEVARLCEWCFD